MDLAALIASLRDSKGFAHKRDIARVLEALPESCVQNGDDCAVLADGESKLLFAIEGFLSEFVAQDPWFAGYCGVLVNVSDIYAMGGRPIAVLDALWSAGSCHAEQVLAGLRAASEQYGVPVVGGHTNMRGTSAQLAVAILGRARALLSSFAAQPDEQLLAVYDVRGRYRGEAPYWDASTHAPSERLRSDLEILPAIAEAGLCRAGKDISMGGLLGTTLMLLECSRLGADIDLTRLAPPSGVLLERWLQTFPSYGFLLSVADTQVEEVKQRFAERSLSCVSFGRTNRSLRVQLHAAEQSGQLWDFERAPFIGAAPNEQDSV